VKNPVSLWETGFFVDFTDLELAVTEPDPVFAFGVGA